MKNVCVSAALSYDVYITASDTAAKHGVTLSTLIRLALMNLLDRPADELAALCAKEGRKPTATAAESEAHHE